MQHDELQGNGHASPRSRNRLREAHKLPFSPQALKFLLVACELLKIARILSIASDVRHCVWYTARLLSSLLSASQRSHDLPAASFRLAIAANRPYQTLALPT